MAKVCANCGMALPREDARFCGICGTLVASHPANARLEEASQQSMPSSYPSAPVPLSAPEPSKRHVLREQVVQQPLAQRTHNARMEEVPGWMNRLETSSKRKSTTDVSAEQSQHAPPRDLHVKVWTAETAEDDTDVEKIDTVPLETHVQTKPEMNEEQYTLAEVETMRLSVAPSNETVKVDHQPSASTQNAPMPIRPPVTPVLPAFPPIHSSQDSSPSAHAKPQRKNRVILAVLIACVALLLLGGLWLWHYQPFSVPAITQTQQPFSSQVLGVSLLYPTGWKVQVDQRSSILKLSDSSHTAQFTVQVSRQVPIDVMQYLKQQATQQGMASVKNEKPLSFAGEVWQQIQGNASQSGANYTETLLATKHGNTVVLITELAPQSIYNDEETSIFSLIRSSLKFI